MPSWLAPFQLLPFWIGGDFVRAADPDSTPWTSLLSNQNEQFTARPIYHLWAI
uniref:Uncharacterized protein n=1 Tax=Anguilla anguilla TaxID=7936 RepID=A0A0E9RYM8_ANGAN